MVNFDKKNLSEGNIKKIHENCCNYCETLYINDSNVEDESKRSNVTTTTDHLTESNTESRCINRKHQRKNNSRKIKEAKITKTGIDVNMGNDNCIANENTVPHS